MDIWGYFCLKDKLIYGYHSKWSISKVKVYLECSFAIRCVLLKLWAWDTFGHNNKNGGTNDTMLTLRIREMIMNSFQSLCWLQEFTLSSHLSSAERWIGVLCSLDRSCWTCLCLSCAAGRETELTMSWTPSCGAAWRTVDWALGCSQREVPDGCTTGYSCTFLNVVPDKMYYLQNFSPEYNFHTWYKWL